MRHAPLTVIAVHEVMKSYWTGNPVTVPADTPLLEKLRQSAEELSDASPDAGLVVVGTRGGGGLARLLMGPVSTQVVQHAACPVIVVPHDR